MLGLGSWIQRFEGTLSDVRVGELERLWGLAGEALSVITRRMTKTEALSIVKKTAYLMVPDGSRSVTEDLDEDEGRRRRFARSMTNNYKECGPRWGVSLSFLRLLGKKQLADEVYSILMCIPRDARTDYNFMEVLKELTNYAKMHGWQWGREWMDYVDLSTLGWYQMPKYLTTEVQRGLEADAVQWLGEEKVHVSALWDHVTAQQNGVHDFFSKMEMKPTPEILTIDEYINNPFHWSGAGSSSGERLVAELDGKATKMPRVKWNTALAMEREAVLHTFLTNTKIEDKVFIKLQETQKWRLLVNSNFEMFLQMNFFLVAIQRLVRGHPNTPLLSSRSRLNTWTDDAVRLLASGDIVGLSLDQSGFDHQVEQPIKRFAMRVIMDWVIERSLPSDTERLQRVRDNVLFALQGASVNVFGKVFLEVAGIPSGWSWTALLDTIVNYAQYYSVSRFVSGLGFRVLGLLEALFQGDDIAAFVADEAGAAMIVAAYNLLGYQIKSTKININSVEIEFLRMVIGKWGVRGYLNRLVTSILTRAPGAEDPWLAEERARMMVDQASQALARGADKTAVEKFLLRAVMGATKWKKEDSIDWLCSYTCDGGGGWRGFMGGKATKWGRETEETLPKIRLNDNNVLYSYVADELANWGMSGKTVKIYREMMQSVIRLEPGYRKVEGRLVRMVEHMMSERDVTVRRRWRASNVGGRGFAIPEPRYADGVEPTMFRFVLREMLEVDDVMAVETSLLSPGAQQVSRWVRENFTKACWVEWLSGRWHGTSASGVGVSSELVGHHCAVIANEILFFKTMTRTDTTHGKVTFPVMSASLRAAADIVSQPGYWDSSPGGGVVWGKGMIWAY